MVLGQGAPQNDSVLRLVFSKHLVKHIHTEKGKSYECVQWQGVGDGGGEGGLKPGRYGATLGLNENTRVPRVGVQK